MDIAVLGGTFAPPTVAHCALLRRGMRFCGAEKGIWVPSSLAYMRIWRPDRIPDAPFGDDQFREGILKAICSGHDDMDVYTDEMLKPEMAYTFDTLHELERKYGGRVSFLMGSDLIAGLPGWHRAEELTERFNIVCVTRGGEDAEERLRGIGLKNIKIMEFTDEYSDISATAVRQAVAAGRLDSVRHMVPEAAYEYMINNLK